MEEIVIFEGESQAFLQPENGGLVNRFITDGRDILFPQQIFQTKNGLKKRGGIPILFPNADPITESTDIFHLKQHGFAREEKWNVDQVIKNRAALTLNSDEESKKQYPFDFILNLEVKVEDNQLSYILKIINPSLTEVLPVSPGFHPYFYVPVKDKKNIQIDLPGFDPSTYDFSSTLSFPQQKIVNLKLPDGKNIRIEVSDNFKNWMVWSEPDKPFICLEPWVGKRNALLHPEERINIKPQMQVELSMCLFV